MTMHSNLVGAMRLPLLPLLVSGLLFGCLPGAAAVAHDAPPDHGCREPVRPDDDQDDALWQRFLDEVDAYRACISDFVDANQAAAAVHGEAARSATGDWNAFVRRELNVPEDYPWPPEDGGG
jgi:hypothetical protein